MGGIKDYENLEYIEQSKVNSQFNLDHVPKSVNISHVT